MENQTVKNFIDKSIQKRWEMLEKMHTAESGHGNTYEMYSAELLTEIDVFKVAQKAFTNAGIIHEMAQITNDNKRYHEVAITGAIIKKPSLEVNYVAVALEKAKLETAHHIREFVKRLETNLRNEQLQIGL